MVRDLVTLEVEGGLVEYSHDEGIQDLEAWALARSLGLELVDRQDLVVEQSMSYW
jgi:hypothetical protein